MHTLCYGIWDPNEGYIKIVSVMQKYFDQAISGNWSYNPLQFENNEVHQRDGARYVNGIQIWLEDKLLTNTYDQR